MVGLPCLTEKAIPAGNEGFNGNPVSRFDMGHLGADFPYHSGEFVARDQRIVRPFEFPVEEMNICPANTTNPHVEGNLAFPRMQIGQFFDFEGAGFFNHDCFHPLYLLGLWTFAVIRMPSSEFQISFITKTPGIRQPLVIARPPPVFRHHDCPAGRAMDEESRRERILSGPSSVFPQRKAESKVCRGTSVEARLL
jgi:hypothetical protein